MSTDAFNTWVTDVLAEEGGLTKYGIDTKDHPGVDIANLTRDQAIEIYRQKYWIATKADQLPPSIAYTYADCCVNQGPGEAVILLQQSLGVKADGVLGPMTMAAAKSQISELAFLKEFNARRMLRYAKSDITDYGLGWFRRMSAVACTSTLIWNGVSNDHLNASD